MLTDIVILYAIDHKVPRLRHQDFIRFLNAFKREIPAGKVVHVVIDSERSK